MVKAEYDKHASCSLLIFGIIFGIIEMLKDLLIKMIIIVMSAQLVRICCTIKGKNKHRTDNNFHKTENLTIENRKDQVE